jgi:hypothetical protein
MKLKHEVRWSGVFLTIFFMLIIISAIKCETVYLSAFTGFIISVLWYFISYHRLVKQEEEDKWRDN